MRLWEFFDKLTGWNNESILVVEIKGVKFKVKNAKQEFEQGKPQVVFTIEEQVEAPREVQVANLKGVKKGKPTKGVENVEFPT